MNLKDTYNRIAEDWHKDHLHDDWWQEGTDAFCAALPRGASVLDIGCGDGVKSKYLVEKGFAVTGIDLSDKMIDIARRDVPDATFYVGDMRDLDAVSGTFDGLFAQASLLHIPRAEASMVVEGWMRKLKSHGVLYIGVKSQRDGRPAEAIVKEDDYGYEYERFFSYFTSQEIKALFEGLDFDIVYWRTHDALSSWIQAVGVRKF